MITAVCASAPSPSVEPRTSSQRPDAVWTRARAVAPARRCPSTMLRARLATALLTGGGSRRAASRSSASHISAAASARVIELSAASSARPAGPSRSLALRGQRGEQHRAPQPLGEVAGERRDEARVGRREGRAVGGAQQRQAAPRRRVADEHGAQLVAEPVGPPELAMAPAAVEVAARRRAEARRVPRRARERVEGVEVLAARSRSRPCARSPPAAARSRPPRRRAGAWPGPSSARRRRRTAPREPGSARPEREVAHAGAAVHEPRRGRRGGAQVTRPPCHDCGIRDTRIAGPQDPGMDAACAVLLADEDVAAACPHEPRRRSTR